MWMNDWLHTWGIQKMSTGTWFGFRFRSVLRDVDKKSIAHMKIQKSTLFVFGFSSILGYKDEWLIAYIEKNKN